MIKVPSLSKTFCMVLARYFPASSSMTGYLSGIRPSSATRSCGQALPHGNPKARAASNAPRRTHRRCAALSRKVRMACQESGGSMYAPKVASSKTLKRRLFEFFRTVLRNIQTVVLDIKCQVSNRVIRVGPQIWLRSLEELVAQRRPQCKTKFDFKVGGVTRVFAYAN